MSDEKMTTAQRPPEKEEAAPAPASALGTATTSSEVTDDITMPHGDTQLITEANIDEIPAQEGVAAPDGGAGDQVPVAPSRVVSVDRDRHAMMFARSLPELRRAVASHIATVVARPGVRVFGELIGAEPGEFGGPDGVASPADLTNSLALVASEVKRSAQLEKDILANVSHDLRTPLTLIKGYAETVRDLTGTDEEKRTEQCNIIVDETDRLSALVNSVLELSKVQNGSEKPNPIDFDMSELCFEVAGRYDALCDQNHWTLQLEADHAAPVHADPAMMERVLHNLLGNAFHHIGADGLVILRVIPLAQGCRVEVADHGPGIAPEDLPHLFDRYYRARQDAGKTGTGLGLSITKAILQQHGFAFGVDSALGQGSTFWFTMQDTRTRPNP